MKLKHSITEDIITEGGDELDFDDLDSKQQNKIKVAQKAIGGKRLYIMETIHGLIVAFDDKRTHSGQKSRRMSLPALSALVSLKIRWLDFSPSQQTVSIGI